MRKSIMLITLILGFSISSFSQTLHEGTWVDEEREMIVLTIEDDGRDYWLTYYKDKFKIMNLKEPYVLINEVKAQIEYDKSSDNLMFNNLKFIPELNSRKHQFAGEWKSESNNTLFNIKLVNGGIYWDIKKNNEESVRYYPKFSKDGFKFTIGSDLLYFKIENNVLTDNKGNTYYKIG
ncbi:hypothetical protein SAMN04489761_1191 [Tenacibaculum sp. MAR_2009_124]|uniref:hypothetical protein n=1 Tax=Tenacibaculum sp. MAR_2009_124 TaxID=1250059 RepID=UPI0008994343|nr:hypothetical protein [Tenacibaculum sp. MAR_2009_124]SEB52104.1 hypothetical protein SAMN04489761_1191 [Tenacibaculum sp. MAR_2009_124]